MKPHVVDYRYRCHGIRIVPSSGAAVRFTDFPRDVETAGGTYLTGYGYQFTGLQTDTSLAPGVIDLSGIADAAGLSQDVLDDGSLDGARVYVFAMDWREPVEDDEPIAVATLGKVTLTDGRYAVEIMELTDALNQSVGTTYGVSCDRRFGDAGCGIDLASVSVTGTLTAVTSAHQVADAARSEPDDWFGLGELRYTSGANAGKPGLLVKTYAGGVIETFDDAYYPPAVGDAYELVPGCRKRRSEDCRDKWYNVINFFGFCEIPAGSTYAQVGGQ